MRFILAFVLITGTLYSVDTIMFSTDGQQYGVVDLDCFELSHSNAENDVFFVKQCENISEYTGGGDSLFYRSNAEGATTNNVWGGFGRDSLSSGLSSTVSYNDIPEVRNFFIRVKYSRDNFLGDNIPIRIYRNSRYHGEFFPQDQHSGNGIIGNGWNTFVWSPWIKINRPVWNIAFFGCDFGHENVYDLQRDGSPICGSGNCSSTPALAPGGCWGEFITENSYSDGSINYTVNQNGSINLGHGQDIQVYGDTWVWSSMDTTITMNISCDVGRFWLNDVDFTSRRNSQVQFIQGWNHLEFTSYNQNQSSSITINYDFSGSNFQMCNQILTVAPPLNLQIYYYENQIMLIWDSVDDAVTYKIYSSDNPNSGFSIDTSGELDGNSWISDITNMNKFYYVRAVY